MKIVVTSPSFSKTDVLKEELTRLFPQTVLNVNGIKLQGDRLTEYIGDADGMIVGLEKLDKNVLQKCSNLKIISKYGVGLDNVDTVYCRENNIEIGWTAGVNKRSVAEMTLAFMIVLSRNIHSTSRQLKSGTWNKSGGFDLSGKTVGIIGVGNVGKEIVRLLAPFECTVLVNDIIDQTEYYRANKLIEVSKEYIFRNADILTVHAPLTTETTHMINGNVLSLMKETAFLINTARGPIVVQEDLRIALQSNTIAGAAIDVYDEEPPADRDFLSLPNLICTPHIGGNSYESILMMGRSAIQHLKKYFRK